MSERSPRAKELAKGEKPAALARRAGCWDGSGALTRLSGTQPRLWRREAEEGCAGELGRIPFRRGPLGRAGAEP